MNRPLIQNSGYVTKAEEAGMTYVEPDEETIRQLGRAVREKVWPLMDDAVGKENMDIVRANATKLN